MKHNFNLFFNALFALALVMSVMFGVVTPVAAQAPQPPTQETCDAIVAKFKNVAQWDDTTWQACFAAGMLNAVVDPKHPLPEKFGPAIMDALEKGSYLQLDSPYGDGCDNTLAHPKCSIGFLKLFSSRERLVAFIAKGEFEQAGVLKKGPWTEYSLWVARDFVQVATGEKMSAQDVELFCSGALVLAFAFDGGFPLPEKSPCGDAKLTYGIGERWNGGCDGNASPNKKCTIGERIQVSTWKEVNASTIGSDWNRGSVRVVVASDVATATPTAGASLLPVITSTPATPVAAGKTPVAPAAGSPTAQSTITVTPGVEVPTEDAQAALPAENGSGIWEAIGYCFLGLFFLALLIWFVFFFLPKRVAKQAAAEKARREALAKKTAENAGDEAAAQQPAEDGGAGGGEAAQSDIPSWMRPADETPPAEELGRTPRTRHHRK